MEKVSQVLKVLQNSKFNFLLFKKLGIFKHVFYILYKSTEKYLMIVKSQVTFSYIT